ncbi:MAG: hypothetical protein P9L93_04655 [Candidatus Gorgyraea atricola]|nr:hypothetical protein [Candidatus Gorgyraea atricola]
MIRTRFIKNNRGMILIASYMVITVLVILTVGFASRSIGEQRVASKERDSMQAFWLAEAGLDKAISDLSTASFSATLGSGSYSTQTSSVSSTRYLVVSTGGVPDTDTTDPNNIVRTIRAIVEQSALAGPSGVTSAITANGDVVVRGSAEINGDIDENYVFDFEEIFGISKETMEDSANNSYVDPPNNVTPVSNITWVDIDSLEDFRITDNNWTGNGILVVNGDAKITGGHFEGIIWIIGSLWISGDPVIDGAIFVESGTEFDTTVTGNPTVNFDGDDVLSAFDYLPSDLPPSLISWKED